MAGEAEADANAVSKKIENEVDEDSKTISNGVSRWKCSGCGTADKGKLKLTHDSSFFVCSDCGVADSGPNVVTNPFEKTTESTNVTNTVDVAELVDSTRNSKERRAVRESTASTTRVKGGGNSIAQTSMRRKTATSYINDQEYLTSSQNVIVEFHRLITSSGRAPDLCVFYKQSCILANTTFVKACMHGAVCKNRHSLCPAILEARPAKFVAREALVRVIEKARTRCDTDGSYYELDATAVVNASNAIQMQLNSYLDNATLRMTIKCEFENVFSCSTISKACPIEDECRISERVVKANDDWIGKIKQSVNALLAMQILTSDVAAEALNFVDSFTHRAWFRNASAMPPDLVSLLLCAKITETTGCVDENIENMLIDMGSKFKISNEVIQTKRNELACQCSHTSPPTECVSVTPY